MSNIRLAPAGAVMTGASGDDDVEDEFALDVRIVVSHAPVLGDCPTDDGCGNTCQGDDSSCNSYADDPS